MKRIFIGPKQTTIENNNFFDYSITLFGTNQGNNVSYSKVLNFEYWNPDNINIEIEYYNKQLAKIRENVELMAHNPLTLSYCNIPKNVHLICKNPQNLLTLLDNKFKTRKLLEKTVPMLNYTFVKGKDFTCKNSILFGKDLVIQLPYGSGGSKTYFCNFENYENIIRLLIPDETYAISEYKKNNIPINVHCLIGLNQIEILPPSIQEIEISDKIEYIGSKYDNALKKAIKNKIVKYSTKICQKLKQLGYKGVLGIDYIYANNELYFIEINPRFQGSTRQLDKIMIQSGYLSIFEYNYLCFQNKKFLSIKI